MIYLIPLGRMLWLSICDKETGEYTAEYFMAFFKDGYYIGVLSRTLILSLWSVVFCIIMGYPVAYKVAHMKGWKRSIATTFLVLPLWVSITIRMFGWMGDSAEERCVQHHPAGTAYYFRTTELSGK